MPAFVRARSTPITEKICRSAECNATDTTPIKWDWLPPLRTWPRHPHVSNAEAALAYDVYVKTPIVAKELARKVVVQSELSAVRQAASAAKTAHTQEKQEKKIIFKQVAANLALLAHEPVLAADATAPSGGGAPGADGSQAASPPTPPPSRGRFGVANNASLQCPTVEEVLGTVPKEERWKRYDDPGCTSGCRALKCRSSQYPCCLKAQVSRLAAGLAATLPPGAVPSDSERSEIYGVG